MNEKKLKKIIGAAFLTCAAIGIIVSVAIVTSPVAAAVIIGSSLTITFLIGKGIDWVMD
jgi:uncharacterized membrane protein HdeD (DUF308 family)